MPYKIRKQKCKQSDGDSGSYVLSYKDNKGKKHRACHTSRKKARGQIAAIEAEGIERNETMRITLSEIRNLIRRIIIEAAFVSSMDPNIVANVSQKFNTADKEGLLGLVNKMLSSLSSGSNILSPDLITARSNLEAMKTRINGIEDPTELKSVKVELGNLLSQLRSPEDAREQEEGELRAKLRGMVAGAGGKYDPSSIDALLRRSPTPVGSSVAFRSISTNESLQSLKTLIQEIVLEEAKKKKPKKKDAKKGSDMDGDGDVDAADYKTKVYMAGGVPKNKALKMSRRFDGK